jgi:hypothetical protein
MTQIRFFGRGLVAASQPPAEAPALFTLATGYGHNAEAISRRSKPSTNAAGLDTALTMLEAR